MFKRNLWIVALVAALAMVFVGCGEEREDKSGDWTELDVDWKYIRISGRDANWQGIDLRAGKASALANWTTNNTHTITIYGWINHASPLGQEIKFGNTDTNFNDSWGSAFPRANGKFMLQTTMDWDRISDTANNIRLSVPASVGMYDIYEIIINNGTTDIYKMSEDEDEGAGSAKAGVQTYGHDETLVTEGEFTKWIVAALGTSAVTVKVRDPAAEGGFVPATGIPAVQETGLTGQTITLPAEATPFDATNKVIVWSITNAGGTGAVNTVTNNVITGIANAGTIALLATVTDGTAVGTDFTDTFNIVISTPDEVELTDFDNNRAFGYNSQHVEDNTYRIGWNPEANEGAGGVANYGQAGFNIGQIVDGGNYASVTITYITDKQVRIGFFNGTVRDQSFQGGWQGWIDLDPAADASDENEKTINIPAASLINGFAIENKEAGDAIFTFVSVVFELDE